MNAADSGDLEQHQPRLRAKCKSAKRRKRRGFTKGFGLAEAGFKVLERKESMATSEGTSSRCMRCVIMKSAQCMLLTFLILNGTLLHKIIRAFLKGAAFVIPVQRLPVWKASQIKAKERESGSRGSTNACRCVSSVKNSEVKDIVSLSGCLFLAYDSVLAGTRVLPSLAKKRLDCKELRKTKISHEKRAVVKKLKSQRQAQLYAASEWKSKDVRFWRLTRSRQQRRGKSKGLQKVRLQCTLPLLWPQR